MHFVRHIVALLLSFALIADLAVMYPSAYAAQEANEGSTRSASVGEVNQCVSSEPCHAGAASTCNHACHIAFHFLGDLGEPLTFTVDRHRESPVASPQGTLTSVFLAGPERPPQVLTSL